MHMTWQNNIPKPIINVLEVSNYNDIFKKMRDFTELRTADTPDEFWILEHNPVFTLGLAGKEEHILNTNHSIPIVRCDRGGQVTYHGIGQLIIYTLIDLKRIKLSIRDLVSSLENSVILYLKDLNICANSDRQAPGVYVNNAKIASLGLKVRKGCTYHGLSFNINMDLTPFNYINVCGYKNLSVTQLVDLVQCTNLSDITPKNVAPKLIDYLINIIYKNPHNETN